MQCYMVYGNVRIKALEELLRFSLENGNGPLGIITIGVNVSSVFLSKEAKFRCCKWT